GSKYERVTAVPVAVQVDAKGLFWSSIVSVLAPPPPLTLTDPWELPKIDETEIGSSSRFWATGLSVILFVPVPLALLPTFLLSPQEKREKAMTNARKTKAVPITPLRCAIYTRKSTEEGLDQDFNSLDAQREAAEAYIQSQSHAGWTALATRYDDGGYSGS